MNIFKKLSTCLSVQWEGHDNPIQEHKILYDSERAVVA
jgi:hypothetical protein